MSCKTLRGAGSININNTPGKEDFDFDSKEIINKIDELKDAILKSRLKVDNYNLTVRTPKNKEKGFSRIPKYIKEGFETPAEYRKSKKVVKTQTNETKRRNTNIQQPIQTELKNSVNNSISKYKKKETLTEKEYEDLIKYNELLKDNKLPTIIKKRELIKEIVSKKFNGEEKKEVKEVKEEIKEKPKELSQEEIGDKIITKYKEFNKKNKEIAEKINNKNKVSMKEYEELKNIVDELRLLVSKVHNLNAKVKNDKLLNEIENQTLKGIKYYIDNNGKSHKERFDEIKKEATEIINKIINLKGQELKKASQALSKREIDLIKELFEFSTNMPKKISRIIERIIKYYDVSKEKPKKKIQKRNN